MDLFRLKGRTALVTGAAGHLGRAISEALCEAGAHVILNGRDAEKLTGLAASLTKAGHSVSKMPFDVSDESKIASSMQEIERNFGKLDILVNNAYAGKAGTLETTSVEDFDLAYKLNILAPSQLIKFALPMLKKAA